MPASASASASATDPIECPECQGVGRVERIARSTQSVHLVPCLAGCVNGRVYEADCACGETVVRPRTVERSDEADGPLRTVCAMCKIERARELVATLEQLADSAMVNLAAGEANLRQLESEARQLGFDVRTRPTDANRKRETFAYCKCGHPYSFHSDGHGVGECSDCKCRRYEFGGVR